MMTIDDLRFGYGQRRILEINHFALPDGEALLVEGPSGSGKTSLLFLLAGLLAPQKGRIILNGTDMAALNGRARDRFRGRHIGFVFQQPHLMAPLSVLDNVLVAPFCGGVKADRAWAVHLLESLGLGAFLHRKPHALSQGQMQRVGVARALVHRPAVILADEPTSALDDAACAATLGLLQAHAKEAGAQLVVASHDGRIKGQFKTTLAVGGAR